MNVNEYTSLEFSNSTFSSSESFSPRFIERILLVLIAVVGITGSLYVFTSSSSGNNGPNYQNIGLLAASSVDIAAEIESDKKKFKDYVKISGKKKVGSPLRFKFKEDFTTQRYVVDINKEARIIVTTEEWDYIFKKPGKYTLEVKTIGRGLITTVAQKEIKIK